eukprot:SM000036S13342  [mRNA]  locus=s36:772479:774268:+ [translate_table: standard]
MDAAVEALGRELGKLRTGRATPGMLDHVVVSAYGSLTPLNRVATVSLADAHTLAITLYDPGLLHEVEKGIMESPMGLNPAQCAGGSLTVNVPKKPVRFECDRRARFAAALALLYGGGVAFDWRGFRPPEPIACKADRQAMKKLAIKAGEAAKVSIRRARKEALEELKGAKDEEGMSEDEVKRQSKEVQELTNSFTKKVEEACGNKERELSAS